MSRVTPQRLLNISLIVVLLVLVLPLYVQKGLSDSMDHARGGGTVGGIDFKAYYIAADMVRTRKDFYDVALQTEEVLARGLPLNESYYIYPPLLAITIVPLTALPLLTAARLWFFINLGLYTLSLAFVSHALKLSRVTKTLPLLWIIAFLFPPALYTLYKGQANILVLVLLAAVMLWHRRRPIAAGIFLGTAVMIKVVPVLLLMYFLWKRRRRLSVAAVATVAVLVLAGLLLIGPETHITFVTQVLPSLAQPRPNPANQSLGGFLSLFLTENPFSDYLVHSPTLWKALTLVTSLALIAVMASISHASRAVADQTELEIALVVTAMPIIANIAWVDMFVLLIIPYLALLKRLLEQRRQEQTPSGARGALVVTRPTSAFAFLGAASALLVSSPRLLDLLVGPAGWQSKLLRSPLFLGMPFYGLVALWATLCGVLVVNEHEELTDAELH